MKIIALISLLISVESFSKTVIMPSPFLEPLVEARVDEDSDWIKLHVTGEHMYGARRPDKPVIVELSPLVDIENLEFKLHTGVNNRGPYMSVLNASLVVGDKKFAFPVTATDFIGSYSKSEMKVQFKLNDICQAKGCDFINGEYVYLYINYKGVREIHEVYEWDHIKGAYYLIRYQ